MNHRNTGIGAVLILALLWSGAAFSGEGDAPPAINEEMAAWMKVASPGAHHEHLGRLVGDWKTSAKFWMDPEAPPIETTGSAKTAMILGGRFLQSTYTGDFMGQPFRGIAIDGFDNILEKHVGTWIDNHGTMVMNFIGSCSKDGKVRTMLAEFTNPMGEKETVKAVTTILDDDRFKYESFDVGDAGEVRTMEIIHTRR